MPLGERFDRVLDAARAGGEWAWRDLYRDVAPALARYLRARGLTEVDDLVGETFVAVVRRIDAFDGPEPAFRAWVFTIARNLAVDAYRGRLRRPSEPTTDDELVANGPRGDTEDDALASLETERITRLLDRLTFEQRDVLLMRILGGLSLTEVAEVLGRSLGSVKMLQNRGLAALRKEIAKGAVTL